MVDSDFFFVMHKSAYEIRIMYWSSYCCSSDLIPFAPRGDHLDIGGERIIAEFEADLIVALAGGTMRHRIGTHLTCDLDLALGDQRPRDRRAEQVQPLVERVGAHHREDVLLDELDRKSTRLNSSH